MTNSLIEWSSKLLEPQIDDIHPTGQTNNIHTNRREKHPVGNKPIEIQSYVS